MKTVVVVFLSILIIIFSTNLYAQGEAAVPFLFLDASPELTGMAGTVVALPTTDVYGAWYNPAQLGNFSRTNNIGLGIYPVKTDWLPSFNFSDLTWHSSALALGYTFNSNVPIHVGLGYIYSKFNLGENVWTDESGIELAKFNSFQSCNAISVGAGIDYYAQFNVGLTYKHINSELIPSHIQVSPGVYGGRASVSAFDFGLLINVPIMDLIKFDEKPMLFENNYPFLNVSLGYALLNLGDEIQDIYKVKVDPLPRQAKLGYGVSFGLKSDFNGIDIEIFQFDYSI
jgi:hypothetical protein